MKKLKFLSNITFIASIVYFVYMIISDIKYMLNNENDMTQSISIELKNTIYFIGMLIPFIVMIIILNVLEKKIRDSQIKTFSKITFEFLKRNIIIIIIGIVILIFVAFLFVINSIQDSLIYHPYDDELVRSNLKTLTKELKLEQITINKDGNKYCGWARKNGKNKPTIIYYGGNAELSDLTFYTMDEYWKYYENFNFVMIDYPGYGLSSGSPNYDKIKKMALDTYDYVKNDEYLGNNEIIIIGFSIGTGPATYVAANKENSKLILVAPYSNGIDLYNSYINVFHGPLKSLVKNKYPSHTWAKKIKEPTLIIASKDDEVVNYELSYKLKNNFKNVKFKKFNNLLHNDLMNDVSVLNEINEFITKDAE